MQFVRSLSVTLLSLAVLLAALEHSTAQSGNAPSARQLHTAVWTGSEMIVWGGLGAGTLLNPMAPDYDGSCYNSSANAWTATPFTGAPNGRYFHTAVWTGGNMIIWGGGLYDQYGNFYADSDGKRYDPLLNSWSSVTNTGAPTARASHTAVWTGDEMIVWGGADDNGAFGAGARYNPANNSWTSMTSVGAPSARWNHTAVWTGSNMIIWGGYSGFTYLSDGGRYNPASNAWSSASSSGLIPRSGHTAVWTGDQMIVWGGQGGSYGNSYFNTGSRYNPSVNSWAAVTSTGEPGARASHTAVWTGNEMIVWGGISGATTFNDGGRYDPVADTWTPVNTTGAPSARGSHTAVWTGGEMIVWGGFNGTTNVNDGGRYNPTTDSWTPLPTNAAPPLYLGLTTTNTVLLSWASPAVGHWLEQNNDLGATNWSGAPQTPSDDGVTTTVLLPFLPGQEFYRLK